MSSHSPRAPRKCRASEAFENFSKSFVATNGKSVPSSIRWPLFFTISFDPVAAIAERSASVRSLRLIDFAVRFQGTGGKALRPPTVPGAKAPVPDSGPPPPTRGTLEMPLPTPKPSAVVLLPAILFRPCAWNRWDCCATTAFLIMSSLSGSAKVGGRTISPAGLPSVSRILAVLEGDCNVYAPCFDARLTCSSLGGSASQNPLNGCLKATNRFEGPGSVPLNSAYCVLIGP